MPNNQANVPQSNVDQSASDWYQRGQQFREVGTVGLQGYSALSNFGQNPLQSALSLGSLYPKLQNSFPGTFTNPQQNQFMQNLNYYGGQVGAYSNLGLQGLNSLGQFGQGNYYGGLQGLQNTYQGVQNLYPGQLPNIPGYANTGIQGVGLLQGLSQGNYAQAGLAGGNLYNSLIQQGAISGTQIAPGLLGGVGGGLDLYQGLRSGNYLQAGAGASNLAQGLGTVFPQTFGGLIGQSAAPAAAQAVSTGATAGVAQAGAGAAAGAGATTASGAGATAAQEAGTSAAGASVVGQVLGGLGAAYGAYNLTKMGLNAGELSTSDTARSAASGAASGAAVGAGVGSIVPGAGTLAGAGIGAIAGGLYGAALGATGSGKGALQKTRDKYRELVIQNGGKLFGADYQGTLADGSKFDFGVDGDSMKLDFEDPLVQHAAAFADVLATGQGAVGKSREAIATLLAKAATSNAKTTGDVDANLKHFMNQLGIDGSDIQATLNKLRADDGISEKDYKAFSNGVRTFSPGGKDKDVREMSEDEFKQVRSELAKQGSGDGGGGSIFKKSPSDSGAGTQATGDTATSPTASRPTPPFSKPSGGQAETGQGLKGPAGYDYFGEATKYVKENNIKPGQRFKVPGDPNSYVLGEDGKITGTLIGKIDPGSTINQIAGNLTSHGVSPSHPNAIAAAEQYAGKSYEEARQALEARGVKFNGVLPANHPSRPLSGIAALNPLPTANRPTFGVSANRPTFPNSTRPDFNGPLINQTPVSYAGRQPGVSDQERKGIATFGRGA